MLKKRTTPSEEPLHSDEYINASEPQEPGAIIESFELDQTSTALNEQEPHANVSPTEQPDVSQRLERLERAHTELLLAVQELHTTLQNIVPRVVRGIPEGETLMYLQTLDNRIGVIERYLRMVTAS